MQEKTNSLTNIHKSYDLLKHNKAPATHVADALQVTMFFIAY